MAVAVDLTGLQVSKTLSIMTRGGIYGDMKPGSWAYIWPVDASWVYIIHDHIPNKELERKLYMVFMSPLKLS